MLCVGLVFAIAMDVVAYFLGYDNLVISIKSSDVLMCVKAHELIADKTDYPLHVGITEAGTSFKGLIKSSIGLTKILELGIGDTIRVSLSDDPVKEIKVAKEILSTTMQRCVMEQVVGSTVSVVSLPSDEMKGRIIGKEGRNIQALQRATGVDIMVDDTPGMVVLSSFDPIRRQVARYALERLMKDGRINPSSIEDAVAKGEKEIEKEVVRNKEIDLEDSTNYMYYFSGTDANGKEWSWSTPYYHEILEFIKVMIVYGKQVVKS